jgi:hypothetical protein
VEEEVLGALTVLISLYGDRQGISQLMLEEMAIEIIDNWSFLGIEDIKIAFRMWAKGEIGDGGSELYGGDWNLLVLNRMLYAYNLHRKKILHEIYSQEQETEKDKKNDIERKNNQEKFDLEFISELKIYLTGAKSYIDIPGWVYMICDKKGIITLTIDQKKEIFQRAIKEEKQELRAEMYFQKDKFRIKKIKDILQSEYGTERAKVIAGQIAVFENKEKILKS